jgi:beta-galactosidase
MISIADFPLTESASLWRNLPVPISAERPEAMESIGQAYGYILYRTHLSGPRSGELQFDDVHDYASVYVNQKFRGKLDRRLNERTLQITVPSGDATLDVLVENLGRINFGPHLQTDRKGLLGSASFSGQELKNWQVYALPMSEVTALRGWGREATAGPAFHRGHFALRAAGDTFLDVRNLGMGVVWVNGHNLGRAWNIGPQQALFVPGPWLRVGENEVIVFDATSLDSPTLRGTTNPIWKQ